MSLESEAAVYRALAVRFAPPAFACFPGVANATGFQASRTCDAIAMALWPSRGLEIHGVEIKVSRSDWLRELKDPAKAEAVARFCDRWWLAVGDGEIVRAGELPPTWGLLVPRAGKLVAKVDAPKLPADPISRAFLAALLRRAHEAATAPGEAALKAARDEGYRSGVRKLDERAELLASHTVNEARANAETLANFRKGARHMLYAFEAEEIGRQWREGVEYVTSPEAVADAIRQAKASVERAGVILDQRLGVVERFKEAHKARPKRQNGADEQLPLVEPEGAPLSSE